MVHNCNQLASANQCIIVEGSDRKGNCRLISQGIWWEQLQLQWFSPLWYLYNLLAKVPPFHHRAKCICKEMMEWLCSCQINKKKSYDIDKCLNSNLRTSHIFNAVHHSFQHLQGGSRITNKWWRIWEEACILQMNKDTLSQPHIINISSLPWFGLI